MVEKEYQNSHYYAYLIEPTTLLQPATAFSLQPYAHKIHSATCVQHAAYLIVARQFLHTPAHATTACRDGHRLLSFSTRTRMLT